MKIRFLIFGVLLGGAVGLLGSSVEILVWVSQGRPAVLIRQGWEDTHIILMVVCGCAAGCLYGTILSQMIRPETLRTRGTFIFLLTLVAAIPSYIVGTFVSLKVGNPLPTLCANVAVFLISLVIARLLSRSSGAG